MEQANGILGMTRTTTILAGVSLLLLVGGGFAVWYFGFRDNGDGENDTKGGKDRKRGKDGKGTNGNTTTTGNTGNDAEALIDPSESDALHDKFFVDASQWAKHFEKKKIKKLSTAKAYVFATAINSSWGSWNDDEAKVYRTFTKIKTKADVSRVATVYEASYQESLKDALKRKLDADEVKKVEAIISQKETYETV